MSNIHLKEPKTFKEQLNILKDKNVIIDNEELALNTLSKINYYRLSAYGLTLKKKDKDLYKDGVSFRQIKRIYDFDKRLRELLLYHLEIVEVEFRTKIAYFMCMTLGLWAIKMQKTSKVLIITKCFWIN